MVFANDLPFSKEVFEKYIENRVTNYKEKKMNSCAIQTPKGKESSEGKRKIQRWGNNISVICRVKYKIGSVFNSQIVEERSKTLVVKKMCFCLLKPVTANRNSRT